METEQEFNRRVFVAHSSDLTDEDLRRYLSKNITMAGSVRAALIKRLEPTSEGEPGVIDYRAPEVDEALALLDAASPDGLAPSIANVIRGMRAEHRNLVSLANVAHARVLVLEDAVGKANRLIQSIEQTPGGNWFVRGEDPEMICSDALSAIEDALKPKGFAFLLGAAVAKVKGYRWPGVVVAAFRTLAGQDRYVVECTAEAVAGALHIYNAEQLEKVDA